MNTFDPTARAAYAIGDLASSSTWIHSSLMNREPWPVLNISGAPNFANPSFSASAQEYAA
jgi:hypothetical protein